MLKDIVYNDTIKKLNKEELFELLGEPDYIKREHLYYRISETRLGIWTLKTKTMVIKLVKDRSIEWIKIHGLLKLKIEKIAAKALCTIC